MDMEALKRFHASVHEVPPDREFLPPCTLAAFFEKELRPKIYLLQLSLFQDRWAHQYRQAMSGCEMKLLRDCVKIVVDYIVCSSFLVAMGSLDAVLIQSLAARLRQNELKNAFARRIVPAEGAWMFYIVLVLLRVIGFTDDNAPIEFSMTPLVIAENQCEFFLSCCTESYSLARLEGHSPHLDYAEYDPGHSIDVIFPARRDHNEFKLVEVCQPSPAISDTRRRREIWDDIERVIEASIMAMAETEESIDVIVMDGKLVGISPASVRAIVKAMVSRPMCLPFPANRIKGLQTGVVAGGAADDIAPYLTEPAPLPFRWSTDELFTEAETIEDGEMVDKFFVEAASSSEEGGLAWVS